MVWKAFYADDSTIDTLLLQLASKKWAIQHIAACHTSDGDWVYSIIACREGAV